MEKNGVSIDTPEALYERFKFVHRREVGSIIDKMGRTIRMQSGTLRMVSPTRWELVAPEGEIWTIDKTRGCNCRGQPITPKVP